jgi:hypothetical protein
MIARSFQHMAVLRHIADMNTWQPRSQRKLGVDIRGVSERQRQIIIDLGMHEPPLVDIPGDMIDITAHGLAALIGMKHDAAPPICPRDGFPCTQGCRFPCGHA